MEFSDFLPIFDKIKTLCKECDISLLPDTLQVNVETLILFLNALDQLILFRRTDIEEYKKLEQCVQKNEGEIRKHIGVSFWLLKIEQQLKLYVDALKSQYEESQKERVQLLENSKAIIKQLKKENEKLFRQVEDQKKQVRKERSKIRLKKDYLYDESGVKNRVHTIGQISSTSNNKRKVALSIPFKIELSERQNKKKKEERSFVNDIRKKHHQNSMLCYLTQSKKKGSKDRQKSPRKKRLIRDDETRINITANLKREEGERKNIYQSVSSFQGGKNKGNSHQPFFHILN